MSDNGSRGRGQGSGGKCKTQSKGFTLIEVLLAVAIMAFIVSVIYASFFTASRSVEQAEAIRDDTDLARTLIAKMSDDIHNAWCNTIPTGKTVFYGKKQEQEAGGNKRRTDSLYLTTLTNSRKLNSKETELLEVGYFFKERPDNSGYSLMRHEKKELNNDEPPLEGGTDYEVTDKVVELHLRYRKTNNSPWLDEVGSSTPCSQPNALPQTVEISLTLEDGSLYITRVDVGNAR
jgi:prepilin-type N-terminal cleavage/methylation domain-containing protein